LHRVQLDTVTQDYHSNYHHNASMVWGGSQVVGFLRGRNEFQVLYRQWDSDACKRHINHSSSNNTPTDKHQRLTYLL